MAIVDKIKKAEKGQKSATETLEAVPSVLPALMRAQKVQHRKKRLHERKNCGKITQQ